MHSKLLGQDVAQIAALNKFANQYQATIRYDNTILPGHFAEKLRWSGAAHLLARFVGQSLIAVAKLQIKAQLPHINFLNYTRASSKD